MGKTGLSFSVSSLHTTNEIVFGWFLSKTAIGREEGKDVEELLVQCQQTTRKV
jgi:hypothetical protein